MGHTAGESRALRKRCRARGPITALPVVQEPFEGAMSDPSQITYRFDARNKRGVRLRIEAATMRAGIVVLAQLVLCGNGLAATEYAVDGLAVGTQLDFGSAPYREYKCNPSDQFEGLIWCQKSRTEKERRRPYVLAYSLLRSQDGRISYTIVLKNRHFLTRRNLNST
jgi:hypothetical protein